MSPRRETRPYVGFRPTTPQKPAGWRIDPPVSEPKLTMARPAATAAAGPPLLPPGTRSVLHGFRTGLKAEFSFDDPIANSSVLAFPTNTAPCSRRRRTTVASYGGRKPSKMREPAVVGASLVQRTSLSASGIPVSGDAVPAASRRSATVA